MTLLTPHEAAAALAISYKQLHALTKAGHIRYVNVGNGRSREWRRYTQEDLEDFIERRKRQECQSTESGKASHTAMTSKSKVIGIRARPDATISDRLKSLRLPKGSA